MELTQRNITLIGSAFLGLLLIWNAVFIVKETEQALVLQLGKIEYKVTSPGIHLKIPFLQNLRIFEKRIVTYHSQQWSLLTAEKKNLEVDFFVKWRILDPKKYFNATRGDEKSAESRLEQIVINALKTEFAKRSIQETISGKRGEITQKILLDANKQMAEFGIKVVDTRIKQIELPDEVSLSVYERMRAERKRTANELRAEGAEQAEAVRAKAEREREVLLAEAYRDAEQLRGEGDQQAAAIYRQAYQADPGFYAFYRGLKVYENSFKQKQDILVLEPGSTLLPSLGSK